jgi:hypothetical protein
LKAIALLALLMFADSAKPPTISDALKAQFFKAQAQLIQANAQVQQAQAGAKAAQDSFTSAIDSLKKACGEGFQPQMDAQQDPSCVAMPKQGVKKP